MKTTVSIALSTYNGGQFLSQQLESLATQTVLPLELVVTDDQSSDNTMDILKKFSLSAPFPVRVEKNSERLGWRANFIKATNLCQGDLICLCDQDDIWYSNKIERMVNCFCDPGVLLAFHNADLIDVNGNTYDLMYRENSADTRIPALTRPTPWASPFGLTQVFRQTLTRFNKYWPRSVDLFFDGQPAAHDQWFYHLATNLGDVVSICESLVGYRQHGNNAVGFVRKSSNLNAHESVDETIKRIVSVANMLESFESILSDMIVDNQGFDQCSIQRSRKINARLANHSRARENIYKGSSAVKRLTRLARLVSRGAYGGGNWSLGRRALLSDALNSLKHRA